MISITRLVCRDHEDGDRFRYHQSSSTCPSTPTCTVVVWNTTRRCNLACRHCYAHANNNPAADELTLAEGKNLIKDISDSGSKVLLFSGGEPLLRPNLPELITCARYAGLHAAISTNGTLLTPEKVKELKDAGLQYAGVSLDGLAETNDAFRGKEGAFDNALKGIRNCLAAGLKAGVRLVLTRFSRPDLPGIFDLVESEHIPRLCLYHLVYTGRGDELRRDDLSHEETRAALDLIIARTRLLHEKYPEMEVLTVDNHTDGPYLYLKLRDEEPARAARALELLKQSGGNSSGERIGCVSWDGTVYPDQFWRDHPLGNIREKNFSTIWHGHEGALLSDLRRRKELLTGRCASCRWLEICKGNLRARAEAATDELWDPDPACYLTDMEIKG